VVAWLDGRPNENAVTNGQLRKHYQVGQENQLDSLGIMVNVIVLWQTVYTQAALDHLSLAFPCVQRRGAVEVTRLERGRLLPLHLAELLGGIRKAGGDGQADQPRLRICLLVPAGQQSQHPFPDLGIAGAPAGQHLSSDAVALGEQAQQKVLGADAGGAGSNGPVSTATASSFLNCPGVRCGTGWSSAWPERVVAVEGPLADLAASVSPVLPGVPGPLQLPG